VTCDPKIRGTGPTGRFPDGALSPDDEGELRIAVLADDGVVKVAFGKKVSWIGMPPDVAEALADSIRGAAAKLRGPP
jgi:hypothetical protein